MTHMIIVDRKVRKSDSVLEDQQSIFMTKKKKKQREVGHDEILRYSGYQSTTQLPEIASKHFPFTKLNYLVFMTTFRN